MYAFLAWLAFVWFFVLFCDTIFKTCMFHPYFRALHVTGLDIKPLLVYWRITRYNRLLNQLGRWRQSALRLWFDLGAIITCLTITPCLALYPISLYQMFNSSTVQDYDNAVLLPVIPGFNFPWSHWFYFITVILLCSVVHEFGHALSASRERISIENFGFALCGVLPLAFVNLNFDQFRQISRWQQLRILCAGIWHNIVLASVAGYLCLSLPFLLSPVYSVGSAVTITGIHEQSALNHPAGFEIGDIIVSVGDCDINKHEHWTSCSREIAKRSQQGLCVPDIIPKAASKSIESCLNSSGYLHFQESKVKENVAEGVCLLARQSIQDFSACNESSTCKSSTSCMFPVLPSKNHRFIAIRRLHKPLVLYVGTMDELLADVQISRFIQKFRLFPVNYAEAISTFLEYVVIFSSGLACLNMLPILSLDGQFILDIVTLFIFFRLGFEGHRIVFKIINRLAFAVAISLTLLTAYKFYVLSF